MFVVSCPAHGRQSMVPETRIRHPRNTPPGIRLDVECWCGTRITIHTGRRRSRDPALSSHDHEPGVMIAS